MYIYTEKAQRRAEEIGVEPRRAGTIAMCGWRAVSGLVALAWKEKGYIYECDWRKETGCHMVK